MGWVKSEKGVDSVQESNLMVTDRWGGRETRAKRNLQNGEPEIATRRGDDRGGEDTRRQKV